MDRGGKGGLECRERREGERREGSGLGIKGKMGGIGICGRVGERGKKGVARSLPHTE